MMEPEPAAAPEDESGASEAIVEIERTGLRTTAIGRREPTLDDVYLRLTGGRLSPSDERPTKEPR